MQIGELTWTCYHSYDKNTNQADGFVEGGRELDIWSVGALTKTCSVDVAQDTFFADHKAQIEQAWENGSVFFYPANEVFGADVLIVPGESAQIEEALRRFQP